MKGLHGIVFRISKVMDIIGGTVLTLMMLVTVTDVILRFFKKPITGTYELVFLGGAVVIACAIPRTTWEGGHVNVDFALEHLPGMFKKNCYHCHKATRNGIFLPSRLESFCLWHNAFQ